MSLSDVPGFDAILMPALFRMVGYISIKETGVLQTFPTGKVGPLMMQGIPTDSSKKFDFPQKSRYPILSP